MAGFFSVDGRTPVDGDESERENNYDAQAEAHPRLHRRLPAANLMSHFQSMKR